MQTFTDLSWTPTDPLLSGWAYLDLHKNRLCCVLVDVPSPILSLRSCGGANMDEVDASPPVPVCGDQAVLRLDSCG